MISGNARVLLVAAIGLGGLAGAATMLDNKSAQNSVTSPAESPSSVTVPASAVPPAATVIVATAATTVAPSIVQSTVPAEPDAGCAATGPSAAIDRDQQRGWLCLDGRLTTVFQVSTAWSMPDPGVYQVYAKDRTTTSTFGGHISTLKNFVAFTYGKNTGARVAFHAVPVLSDGSLMQPLDSVGDLSRRGESSGCIRVVPDISQLIWDTLSIGDTVTVVS